MNAFWIKPAEVCVEAKSKEEAKEIAERETNKIALEVSILPYPAEPRVGPQSPCPSFCWNPRTCAGHGCCPRNYSCSE